jgi:hypothetical protein
MPANGTRLGGTLVYLGQRHDSELEGHAELVYLNHLITRQAVEYSPVLLDSYRNQVCREISSKEHTRHH